MELRTLAHNDRLHTGAQLDSHFQSLMIMVKRSCKRYLMYYSGTVLSTINKPSS